MQCDTAVIVYGSVAASSSSGECVVERPAVVAAAAAVVVVVVTDEDDEEEEEDDDIRGGSKRSRDQWQCDIDSGVSEWKKCIVNKKMNSNKKLLQILVF